MKISRNTHSSIRIEDTKVLYFDPFHIDNDIHDADIIFITHPHFDHFSKEDIEKVSTSKTIYVIPKSMLDEFCTLNVSNAQIIALSPNESTDVLGISVTAIPAYNIDKPMHKKEFLWLGYLICFASQSIYVAGDTDAIEEGITLNPDLAFIPVGGTYTMDYKEAAAFVNAMQPKSVIPYHYGGIVGDADDGKKFCELLSSNILVNLI